MKRKFETKAIPTYTKEIDDRKVTGFAAVMGNIDSGGDRIAKGAFKKTIAEHISRIRHLWGHDSFAPPVAMVVDLQEVGKGALPKDMRAQFPDAKGALQVTREYLDTPRGDEVLAGLKAGAVNEMSFAYDVIKSKITEEIVDEDDKGEKYESPYRRVVRELTELRLWETSDVNWGMNEATIASKARGVWAYIDDEDKRYKHHDEDGLLVKDELIAAMEELLHDDLSLLEKRPAYQHLAGHYLEIDEVPPAFALVEVASTVADALRQAEEGSELFKTMQEVSTLLRAEPQPSNALTLDWETELRKRKLALTHLGEY